MSQPSDDDFLRRRLITRRDALGVLGAAGVAAVVGKSGTPEQASAALQPSCIATPAETEGPYFVDERLERSDLRLDPTTGAMSAGAPLLLRVVVARVDGAGCAPIPGAFVDIWQCDALGVYSDVKDFAGRFDTRGKKFLRGHQVTDAKGMARFTTVYPGWYEGRAVHIHFKVRTFDGPRTAREFTSQWYFDDALTDRVHDDAPYKGKGKRDTRNAADRIYRNEGGAQLHLAVEREAGGGYGATFSIGLRLS